MKYIFSNMLLAMLLALAFVSCKEEDCIGVVGVDCPPFQVEISDFAFVDYNLSKGIISWQLETDNDHGYHWLENRPFLNLEEGVKLNGIIPVFEINFKSQGTYNLNYQFDLEAIKQLCYVDQSEFIIYPPVSEVSQSFETGTFTLKHKIGADNQKILQEIVLDSATTGKTTTFQVISFRKDENSNLNLMTIKTSDLAPMTIRLVVKSQI